MTSAKQIAANRRNSRHSTGPRTRNGKDRSRRNSWLHGLTAETVIGSLEDIKQYEEFESAVVESYAPRSPVQHELTLRLASLLWRLRRATAIETGLFRIQAEILRERRTLTTPAMTPSNGTVDAVRRIIAAAQGVRDRKIAGPCADSRTERNRHAGSSVIANVRRLDIAQSFLRLVHHNNVAFDRVGRYEGALWRQTAQTLLLLGIPSDRKGLTAWQKSC